MDNMIAFLGTRGSAPANHGDFHAYGGETSSYAITLGGKTVFVDAGSGIARAGAFLGMLDEVHILLTHTHMDHINGLFPLAQMIGDKPLHIYGSPFEGMSVREQLSRLYGPPIWPTRIEDDVKNVFFHDITETEFSLRGLNVKTMREDGEDPSTLYRIDGNGASVVIAADFDHRNGAGDKLVQFAENADLLVYDGALTTGEYVMLPGLGHSTADMGAEIAQKCHAKHIAITAHGHRATDDELDLRERALRQRVDNLFFAYNGLTFEIGGELPGFCKSAVSNLQGDKFKSLMETSIRLTSETDSDKLLQQTISSAMEITCADGGVLYLHENGQQLRPSVGISKSQGFFYTAKDLKDSEVIKLSLSNVVAAATITKKTINIDDINDDKEFDFADLLAFDEKHGIRSHSTLIVPMENVRGEVIGVIQLVNKLTNDGKFTRFNDDDVESVEAIAALAGAALANISYSDHITDLLNGFVRGISTGIDARTPYNANHTRNMVAYCNAFLDYEKDNWGPYAMEGTGRTELNMAIWLHDIGKLATPLDVMDKANRLTNEHFEALQNRYGRMELLLHLALARGEFSQVEFENRMESLLDEHQFLLDCNSAGYLPDEKIQRIELISLEGYKELNGEVVPKLTSEEVHELCIQKGTLTSEERHIMQEHVEVTAKMLSMLDFPKDFKQVATWASTHHEFLDGSGYPRHLTAEQLSWPARLITILDIFEALTAADRPYRKSMTVQKALSILEEMVGEGKLDGNLFAEFKASNAWEETLRNREGELVITVSDWHKM